MIHRSEVQQQYLPAQDDIERPIRYKSTAPNDRSRRRFSQANRLTDGRNVDGIVNLTHQIDPQVVRQGLYTKEDNCDDQVHRLVLPPQQLNELHQSARVPCEEQTVAQETRRRPKGKTRRG